MSSKQADLADLLGEMSTTPKAPPRQTGLAAATVPLDQLVLNPFNPRRTSGQESIEETAASLRERGQIQPITVVTRKAFLIAHPGQEPALGDARFVALDGNRRLRAARLAGLTGLRVDVNDDLAASASGMLEAALIANIHREDVPPIEEARAIQELLDRVYEGNQAAVGRALGKAPQWVGQRLALLHLTPALQEQVDRKELGVKQARKIGAATRAGKLAPEAQQAAADRAVAEAAQAPRAVEVNPVYPARPEPAPSDRAPDVNPVYPGTGSGPDAELAQAEVNPVYSGPVAEVPEPRGAQPAVIVLSVDRTDLPTAAKAIRDALSARESYALAEAIIDSLRENPELAATG